MIEKHKTDNGLNVLLCHDDSYPVVAIQAWVNVGSISEPAELQGISHFIEHLVFKGTKNYGASELGRAIEGAGGELNAYTTFEQTVYHVTLASRYLETGLKVISDMMQNPLFESKGIESEKKVIIEEIKESEDSPDVRISQKLFEIAYGDSQYSKSIVGTENTLHKINESDIRNHFEKFYRPDNMTLVVAGDFSQDLIWGNIKRLFNKPVQGVIEKPDICSVKEKHEFDFVSLEKGENEYIIELGFKIPSGFDPDSHVLDLISIILGEGENSRLYKELLLSGISREASSYPFSPLHEGLFIFRVSPFETSLKESIKVTFDEIVKLKNVEVTDDEMERAKALIEKDIVFQEETVHGKAKKIGFFESVYEDYKYEDVYLESILNSTKSDLKDVANKYFKQSHLTVAFLSPQGRSPISRDDIKDAIEKSGL